VYFIIVVSDLNYIHLYEWEFSLQEMAMPAVHELILGMIRKFIAYRVKYV